MLILQPVQVAYNEVDEDKYLSLQLSFIVCTLSLSSELQLSSFSAVDESATTVVLLHIPRKVAICTSQYAS